MNFEGFDVGLEEAFEVGAGEEEAAVCDELAFVFLCVVLFAVVGAFFVEKRFGDARALPRQGLCTAASPDCACGFGVEGVAFAIGRGDENDIVIGYGERGAEGEIERVRDAGGFIEDEERDLGEAADFGVGGRGATMRELLAARPRARMIDRDPA